MRLPLPTLASRAADPSGAGGAEPQRARSQLGLFLAAYLLHTAGRWVTAGVRATPSEPFVQLSA